MIRNFLFMRRHMAARRKLQRMVEANARSFEIADYRRRRAAALRHTRET